MILLMNTCQQELARAVSKSEYSDDFAQKSSDDALKMLENDDGKAGRLWSDFLTRHGHRGLMEFELSTEPWGLDPHSLISVIQTMVANPASLASVAKKIGDDQDLLASKPIQNHVLKFILSRARDAVVCREKTKSLCIRTVHCFRMAYRRLAQLMVLEGKIPDAGLIYFFTNSELEQVVNSRGAAGLINKAVRRRKLRPEMEAVVLPEMSLGLPKAEKASTDAQWDDSALGVQLKGAPVFAGTVRATVRVALNLEEAKQIQCGEVLIASSTDIGWSPYFPLLSGVVTELGGLISHGAVVAREYVSLKKQ